MTLGDSIEKARRLEARANALPINSADEKVRLINQAAGIRRRIRTANR